MTATWATPEQMLSELIERLHDSGIEFNGRHDAAAETVTSATPAEGANAWAITGLSGRSTFAFVPDGGSNSNGTLLRSWPREDRWDDCAWKLPSWVLLQEFRADFEMFLRDGHSAAF